MKPSINKPSTAITFSGLLTHERLKLKAFQLILTSALLAGVSASAQAAPDWSACIGTGRAAYACRPATSSSVPLARGAAHSSTLPWSAFIGTGQVSADSDRRQVKPQASSDAALPPAIHWSAKIGNGHVIDVVLPAGSRMAALPAVGRGQSMRR
jgi:hypothetical protein